MSGGITTEVDIVNMALTGFLGKPGITSFNQPNNASAIAGANWYPIAEAEVATATPWTFLRERRNLAQVTNDRSTVWSYAYDFPSRAHKFYYLVDPGGKGQLAAHRDYEIGRGVIYADLSPVEAYYTTLEDKSISDWPIAFNLAIAAKVAEYLAPSMTRRASDVENARIRADQELAKAIEWDAQQEFSTYVFDDAYVTGTTPSTGAGFWKQADFSSIWDS